MKQAYPLTWPAGWKRTAIPTESKFGKKEWASPRNRPTVAQSIDAIIAELRRMGASNVIISTNVRLKSDGYPYSGQSEPRDTGVAVYFTYQKAETVIACDSFNRVGCNLTAIAKTLDALRGIERWGCSELMNKAFTGFAALPEKATQREWWEVLQCNPDASEAEANQCYRQLVKLTHPDKGGNVERFHEVQNAWSEAKQHFLQEASNYN